MKGRLQVQSVCFFLLECKLMVFPGSKWQLMAAAAHVSVIISTHPQGTMNTHSTFNEKHCTLHVDQSFQGFPAMG